MIKMCDVTIDSKSALNEAPNVSKTILQILIEKVLFTSQIQLTMNEPYTNNLTAKVCSVFCNYF